MKLGKDEIYLAKKIRLIPTKEQEKQFWKSANTARWAYNFFLHENEILYKYGEKYFK